MKPQNKSAKAELIFIGPGTVVRASKEHRAWLQRMAASDRKSDAKRRLKSRM